MSKRNEAPPSIEATSMDQVRDILFGAQLKDLEARFQRQEERLSREINDARDALKKRLDSLENFMKSENASLLNRIKEEGVERDSEIKNEQRERSEALKSEQRERNEALKNEQRERADACAQLAKDLASAAENFERKLAKLSGALDATERDLRQLLLTESGSLADKVEEKYQEALEVIAGTAAQVRHDMVYRTSLSGLFNDVAVKLSHPWNGELGQMMPGEPGAEAPRKGRNVKTGEEPGAPDA
jgi:DNA repair exonuclease SbcCD ATPase subunit